MEFIALANSLKCYKRVNEYDNDAELYAKNKKKQSFKLLWSRNLALENRNISLTKLKHETYCSFIIRWLKKRVLRNDSCVFLYNGHKKQMET